MLNDFSWNMTGYIPKHQVNPHGDGIIHVERQRRLAAARQARDDHQLIARDGEVDVLEVVLAGTLDDDGVLSHVAYRSFYRSQPGAAPEANMATGELSFPCNRSF